MSSSPALEHASPSASTPSSPALRPPEYTFQTSTPNFAGKKPQPPLNVSLPPPTPTLYAEAQGSGTLTPPPVSPGAGGGDRARPATTPAHNAPDGTSSDKSSETAVPTLSPRSPHVPALSRKESYKAQRQHYRREKKRATSALLHSIEDPSVPLLADWLKVRGSLKSWTKLWCVLKPGLLLLYKSPKAKSSHWVGTVLLTSCQVIERPSKKDGFCFKLYHPLEQSIWAPRGPHNETIGAVVQPLPTAHLIFRAPSPAAGHCWLDGLELALRTTSAMLRCVSRVETDAPRSIDHEDLERHFNEHELAGAASDSDSDAMQEARDDDATRDAIVARFKEFYTEDMDREIGAAGELVEEVAEENKSLLWFLLKQVRPGMDLSKVVLPTFILEPRSFLDKLADNYYHADILGQAARTEDPYLRFKTVLRWYLSGLYKKPKGLKKPYNPVLGECFRCCWKHSDDSYTIYIAEQVSHHPPVSAFYVSNRKEGFVIEGSLLAKSKFYGNSTSAILEGCVRIHLPRWKETYYTTAPYAHCKGIVIGTLSMELGGKVQLNCPETGYHADIEFKLRSFLGSSEQTNCVSGRVKKGKDTVASVDGYWDGKIDFKDKRTGEETTLLDVATLKEQRLERYLVKYENLKEYESQKLWIKVSDAIRNDDQVAATEEKTVIEELQRAKARNITSPWQPRYFHSDKSNNVPEGVVDQGWKYNYVNINVWEPDESIEYEEEFIVRSLRRSASAASTAAAAAAAAVPVTRLSDTDSDRRERPHNQHQRTLKQTLCAIDSALREQTQAIERLSRNVQAISERQCTTYRQTGRMPTTSLSWELLVGIMVAMLFQALLSWMFQH